MSYFVYVLKSRFQSKYYVGMSNDPQRRLTEHNQGKVTATKSYRPYEIVLIEEFPDRQKAHFREKYYKTGFGRKVFMKKISS